jgi:uroporphyrin-3 C-methyltransferase
VRYLAKLANYKLQFDGNVPLAIKLLENADKNLSTLSDSRLLPIRKALTNDIQTLKMLSTPDKEGVYLKLSAIDKQVSTLPLPTVKPPKTDIIGKKKEPLPDDAKWWKKALNNTKDAFNQLVIIRHTQKGSEPFVDPDEIPYLYQNLHALLNQTMWAVLNNNTQVYTKSLDRAVSWIEKYFVESPSTQEMVTQLNDLKTIELSPALPNVSGSINAFNQYFIEPAVKKAE